MGKTTVSDLETRIWKLEGFRVIIRCPSDSKVEQYPFERKAAGNASLTDWFNSRLLPLIGDYETVVLDGNGTDVHGRTRLDNIRSTYDHEK